MKNSQKGFVAPALLTIIALLVIGGGIYVYKNNKASAPVTEPGAQINSGITNSENTPNNSLQNSQLTEKVIATTNSSLVSEKASGIIKSVYSKDGKNYLDIDYVTINPNWKPGGMSGSSYTNDNTKIRTFEISKDVKIFAADSTFLTFKKFSDFFIQTGVINGVKQFQYQAYNPWDIEVLNGEVVKITEHYLP